MLSRTLAFTALGVLVAVSAAAPATAAGNIDELRAAARKPPTEPGPALKLAQDLRRAGLFKEGAVTAKSGLIKAREKADLAQLRFEMARNFIGQRQIKKALAECAQIGKLSKITEKLCSAEAQLYNRRGSEALPIAEEALALEPNNYDAMVFKGRALYQLGRPDEAETSLQVAIQQNNSRAEARLYLGEIWRDRNQREKALAILREARRGAPDDPDVLIMLGSVLPPGSEAVEVLERAASIRPTAAAAHARLGEVLLAQHQLDRAETALREALKLEPNHPSWLAALGRLFLERKRPEDALKTARDALKITGNDAGAKLVEANALAAKGDIDLAIAAFEEAYGMSRTDPAPLVDAGRACLEHKRPTTAEAFSDRATQDFPAWAPAWELAGDVAVAQGEKAAARKAYQEALKRNGPVDRVALKRKIASIK